MNYCPILNCCKIVNCRNLKYTRIWWQRKPLAGLPLATNSSFSWPPDCNSSKLFWNTCSCTNFRLFYLFPVDSRELPVLLRLELRSPFPIFNFWQMLWKNRSRCLMKVNLMFLNECTNMMWDWINAVKCKKCSFSSILWKRRNMMH